MSNCLICESPIDPFISFGRMPIANGFLPREAFDDEFFFNLGASRCPKCSMVQLTELVDPKLLFHENYAYFSSISSRMAVHFRDFAGEVRHRIAHDDPFVVEIGSNDGIMLKHFAAAGLRHMGVEPSENVAEAARKNGVETICAFFNEETAADLVDDHGLADVLLGANVFCHLPDLHSVLRGADKLLKGDGVLVLQDPYLGDIIERASFDQIYDEHVFYFSVTSLAPLFAQYGMEIIDLSHHDVHGGSMRYTVARKGARKINEAVEKQKIRETELRLGEPETFSGFRDRVETIRAELRELLSRLRSEGKRVTGYGATSKSTTVTNYCGIGPDLVEFISDTTPGKQNLFSPGAHIPVVPYSRFAQNPPDYALLFAWNHGAEIEAKETAFVEAGGKFIHYVPRVGIRP